MNKAFIVYYVDDETVLNYASLIKLLNPKLDLERFVSTQSNMGFVKNKDYYGMINGYGFCYIGKFFISSGCNGSDQSKAYSSCKDCPGVITYKFDSRIALSPSGKIIDGSFPKNNNDIRDGEIELKDACTGYAQIVREMFRNEFTNKKYRSFLSIYVLPEEVTKQRLRLLLAARSL